MNININTHNCTTEELKELKDYLNSECWDFTTDESNAKYVLAEDHINDVQINPRIYDEELYPYQIVHRTDLVHRIFDYIGEARGSDRIHMASDIKLLQNMTDTYIFSSIATNCYIDSKHVSFNDICRRMLDLHNTLI